MYIDLTLQSLFFSLPFPLSVADLSAPASSTLSTGQTFWAWPGPQGSRARYLKLAWPDPTLGWPGPRQPPEKSMKESFFFFFFFLSEGAGPHVGHYILYGSRYQWHVSRSLIGIQNFSFWFRWWWCSKCSWRGLVRWYTLGERWPCDGRASEGEKVEVSMRWMEWSEVRCHVDVVLRRGVVLLEWYRGTRQCVPSW